MREIVDILDTSAFSLRGNRAVFVTNLNKYGRSPIILQKPGQRSLKAGSAFTFKTIANFNFWGKNPKDTSY